MTYETKTELESCVNCGDNVEDEDFTLNDDIYCEDCYNDSAITCEECSDTIHTDDCHSYDSIIYCESCFDDNVHTCEYCNDLVHSDKSYTFNDNILCRGCYEEYIYTCDRCSDEIHRDDMNAVDYNIVVCEDCYCEYYFCCDTCGEVYPQDCGTFTECGTYCEDCHPECKYVRGYHEFDYPPMPKTWKPLLGIELETDNYDDMQGAADILYEFSNHEKIFHMESDSSLDNGIEIIFHANTFDYWKAYNFKKVFKAVKRHGAVSHNAGTCGLHIHLDKRRMTEHQKDFIIEFFDNFWENIVKFSRRSEEQIDDYAEKYGVDFDKESIKSGSIGRHFCLNFNNIDTLEFRIFRGTLREQSFRACIEFVAALEKFSFSGNMSWFEFMEYAGNNGYTNLCEYAIDKGLFECKQFESREKIKRPDKPKPRPRIVLPPRSITDNFYNFMAACDDTND